MMSWELQRTDLVDGARMALHVHQGGGFINMYKLHCYIKLL